MPESIRARRRAPGDPGYPGTAKHPHEKREKAGGSRHQPQPQLGADDRDRNLI
ncbi:MAG: hypothetical protein AB2705_15030 [Candidatus Thiodiazotropha sp.]